MQYLPRMCICCKNVLASVCCDFNKLLEIQYNPDGYTEIQTREHNCRQNYSWRQDDSDRKVENRAL